MMKTQLIVLLSLIYFIGLAQNESTNIILDSNIDSSISTNLNFKVSVLYDLDSKNYATTLTDVATNNKSKFFSTSVSIDEIAALIEKEVGTNLLPSDKNKLNAEVQKQFPSIMKNVFDEKNVGPLIASIKVFPTVKVHNYKTEISSHSVTITSVPVKVEKVRLVFEDGFITQVHAEIKHQNKVLTFSNIIPIGITTRANIVSINNQRLFNQDTFGDNSYIILGEVLKYHNFISVKTKDFSPRNQTIDVFPDKEASVYKSAAKELFELRTYADLAGINQDNPNGLVQLEVEKKINFYTYRKQTKFNSGTGILTYILPSFELNKIEENNKFASLYSGSLNDSTIRYISPLQVKRHQIAAGSMDINLLSVHGSAVNINLDMVLGMGHTFVKDSSELGKINEPVNTTYWGGKLEFTFNPSKSWDFKFSTETTQLNCLNENLLYYSMQKNNLVEQNKWLNILELAASWETSEKNTLFARIRLTHEMDYWHNNYMQFQFGTKVMLSTKQ